MKFIRLLLKNNHFANVKLLKLLRQKFALFLKQKLQNVNHEIKKKSTVFFFLRKINIWENFINFFFLLQTFLINKPTNLLIINNNNNNVNLRY